MTEKMNGIDFANALKAGTANLRRHMQAINDLNVFPIPDGDTGSNMLMTVLGGVDISGAVEEDLSVVARKAADGMLLSARGNSGVILSQLFDGIAVGLEGIPEADACQLSEAFRVGVKHAYGAVMAPTEGTILTVARCAAEYGAQCASASVCDYFKKYLIEAKRSLDKTPELLPVLKKAGVVDSGGAGLLRIVEGMYRGLTGDLDFSEEELSSSEQENSEIDLDLFTSDSVLEYGYCTEFLLRLQRVKTDPDTFDVSVITDFLKDIGDSVVAFKTGSIVKVHVHTMTPHSVLGFCQQFGEFLTLKIENMALQHNNASLESSVISSAGEYERKKYGVVAVCSGDGIKEMFLERGADVIVDGGQSMNPSTEDFIKAFRGVPAENLIVLPNNSNVILSAKQAGELYEDAKVFVLESKTVGDGYAALAMMNPEAETIEELMAELQDAMKDVVTAEIAPCIRDAEIDGISVHRGDYLGVVGKDYIASSSDRLDATCKTLENLGLSKYDICIILRGKDVPPTECAALEAYINGHYPHKETYISDGMQDIYHYILILQ